ncbi:orotate phosphoribosyltransferase [archaeon]|jgi:orotate phosphoribosyltransferase|nr:orotate phosphoribosyltransferase [archaeon]MDP6547839.1 orotate phosphoribosyltransferase [Candidatus Woesearchaeota archaeon]|tara:strand:+ start:28137 stop:28727 length:591 start_codon:yes stop_codon:yes gene_type:complete
MNEKIAKALADANVVKFGKFELASGKISPIYIDLRILPSYPEPMAIVTEELCKLIKKLQVDIVAGAETAGIPLAAAISIKSKIPMIYVRKRPKSYGRMEMVEGVLKKDQKVVLIDDMATNGYSKVKFISGIRHSGGIVNDTVIVLDRGQGASENLAKENVKLHSLITLKELLEYMKKNNLIEEEKHKEILDYLEEK